MVSIEGVSEKVLSCLNHHVFKSLHLAYVYIDHELIVQERSKNWADYGFVPFNLGDDVSLSIDFFVGIDTTQRLILPIVGTPSGQAVSVTMLPMDGGMVVTILDASSQMRYRSRLQQAANENELLINKQSKLMAMLQQASSELEFKNKQLEDANRLQTGFLSGVSHEFRTPLASIIGYTDRVQKNLDELLVSQNAQFSGECIAFFGRNKDHVRAANRSSQHLLSLVENLLDHGKFDSNEIMVRPKSIDLKEIFEDVSALMQPLCESKNIKLSIKVDEKRPEAIFIDDSRLRQCLINLIGNAVKFTDDGGVSVLGVWREDRLFVTIDDTGLGIGEEDLAKIKLPFWQAESTGKAGTGLGLTITEKIIDLMGGKLTITSAIGEGTHVKFDLLAPKIEVVDQQKTIIKPNKPLRILLAEDDLDIADLVVMMLVEGGVDVTHVTNGAAALELIKESSYDLVLMDLNMPVMSGYEAIDQLRDQDNHIPVVVMSASTLDDDSHPVKKLDCDAYLVKPVSVEDILKVASQLVT